MTSEITFVSQVAGTSTAAAVATERGFVKEVVTCMVMDNLEVTPISTISSITFLNKFTIRELGSLEEKVVNFGLDELSNVPEGFPKSSSCCLSFC
ncbi:hypothetical protein WN944_018321 [Citrus x changshan-huyou]|uniref:Uncharacterized protein n=1 Tax=Citrus x changshan-huyou TaxID=2935761 RepID=A0AAP0QD25_9ROSI